MNLLHNLLKRYMAWAGLMLYAFDPADPKDKDAVQGMIDEAVAGLKAKNAELIAELRAAKRGQEIKPEQLAALEDQVERLTAERDQAIKDGKAALKQVEKLTADLTGEQQFTQRLLVDNGLTEALVKANVAAPLMPAAKAMLAGQVKIIADGDSRKAVIGDKALVDHVSAWAASDEGKHFVAAPNNSGGGAAGGTKGAGGADLSKLPPAQRLAAAREAQATR